MRFKKLLLVLVACVLSLSIVLPVTTAFAGVNRLEVASVSTKEAGWEYDINDLIDWNKTAQFKATTLADATVTTSEYFLDECVDGLTYYSAFDAKLNITSFDADSYFAFSWGAQDYSDNIGVEGVLEVYVKAGSTGKITVGTRITGTNEAVEAVDVATIGTDFDIHAEITADKKLNIFINGVDDTPEVTAEYANPFMGGLFSFGQKGKTTTEVISLIINRYDYESPANPDYLETFDAEDHSDGKAGYSTAMFASYSTTGPIEPSYLHVDTDETGNSYLRFNNTCHSHIVTKYQYSNFEMTFDLFDFGNRYLTDEEGNSISFPAATFMVYVGASNASSSSSSLEAQVVTYYGWIAGTSYGSMNFEKEMSSRQAMTKVGNTHIFRDGEGRTRMNGSLSALSYVDKNGVTKKPVNMLQVTESGISEKMKVKIQVIDGVYKLYVIMASDYELYGEEAWDEVGANFAIDLGFTPKGFVGFGWSGSDVEGGNKYSTTAGNASVDNLRIKNLDAGGATIRQEDVAWLNNTTTGYTRPDAPYNYNDFYNDNDLLSNKLVPGGTASGMSMTDLIIIIASAVVIVGVGTLVAITYLKRRVK